MQSLQEVRKELGFTQEEAAKALNLSRRAYQNHENGYLVNKQNDRDLIEQLQSLLKVDEEHGYVTVKQIKEAVRELVEGYPNIKSVYLFGSCARGDQREDSDIDLLVLDDVTGWQDVGFFMGLKKKLHKNVDITSYRQISDDPVFLRILLTEGIKLYG